MPCSSSSDHSGLLMSRSWNVPPSYLRRRWMSGTVSTRMFLTSSEVGSGEPNTTRRQFGLLWMKAVAAASATSVTNAVVNVPVIDVSAWPPSAPGCRTAPSVDERLSSP